MELLMLVGVELDAEDVLVLDDTELLLDWVELDLILVGVELD